MQIPYSRSSGFKPEDFNTPVRQVERYTPADGEMFAIVALSRKKDLALASLAEFKEALEARGFQVEQHGELIKTSTRGNGHAVGLILRPTSEDAKKMGEVGIQLIGYQAGCRNVGFRDP